MKRSIRPSALFLLFLFALPAAHAEEAGAYLWPAPHSRIVSQGYAPRAHEAIDIAGRLGDSIVASGSGTVIYALTGCKNTDGLQTGIRCGTRAGCSKRSVANHPLDGFCNYGFGNGVVLRHSDGAYTVYAHFSYVDPSLRRGRRVEQGLYLGDMGTSGRSAGVHLHFSVTAPRSPGFTKNRLDPAEVFPPFVYVATAGATEITAHSARLEGVFSFLGPVPEQVGILMGESPSLLALSPEYLDTEFPDLTYMKMVYDVDNIGGWPLRPGATYFWQCYAIQNGRMELGEIKRFTTLEDSP